ncbi:uncharacterized protein LOC116200201 isoform X2 [Punica granatum]|uniref:RING-type E3 ubiquitin transferase n=1 Tax=Punica granatum TaxID=22663 RepID=A0A6P8CQP2_PUNGR|nr:uncharacterized protein LOC116200201 isoform X2 [Punica granatum]
MHNVKLFFFSFCLLSSFSSSCSLLSLVSTRSTQFPKGAGDIMTRKKDRFWEYAERLNGRFKCNFCRRDFAGGAPRVKSHLSGIKGRDIDICTKVPKDVQLAAAAMIKGANKRPKTEAFSSNSDGTSSELCEQNDSSVLDDLLAKFLLLNSVDSGVVQSSSFIDFINAVAAFGAAYKPSHSTLKTVVIPKLLGEVEAHVRSVKESWGETGCTLISDVLCDEIEKTSFINIMAYSWKGVVLLNTFKVPTNKLTSDFLEVIICFSIKTIGANNVVQYINGAPSLEPTGALLANEYPHIYMTHCVAAEIQSLFEEVYHKIEWVHMVFDDARCLLNCIYGHSDLLSLIRKHTNNRELRQPQMIEFSSNYDMLRSIIELKTDEDKEAFVKQMMDYHAREPKLFNKVAEIMLNTSHPCKWWAYCGNDVPILMKYAIRILSQPCSGSAFKQSLNVFQSSHNEKQKRSALGASYHQRSLRMNMILTARFTASGDSDKQIDLTQLSRPNSIDMSISNDFLNEAGVPQLDVQPTQRSDLAAEQCPSWKCLQLQFVTQISSFQVTGQEVTGEQGHQIHVFLVNTTTGNVVQSGALSMLKLAVSALQGDFDEEARNIWTREDFEENEISSTLDVPLMSGDLQVTLKGGMGTLGDVTFNYDSSIARSGKFRLGVKSFTDDSERISVREGISNAFIVKDRKVTREPDAAADLTRVPENSQLMMTDNMDDMARLWSPLQNIADGETELYSQFFGSMWNAEAEYKHKQKDNIKSRQAAMRWLKLKAILQWAILRRMVVRKRAQKMSVRTQVQKRPEEYSNKGLARSAEDEKQWRQFPLDMQELGKDKWKNNEKPLLPRPPQEAELESAQRPNSSIGNSSTFPKPNILQSRQPLTLFPSLLAGNDMEPMEIEGESGSFDALQEVDRGSALKECSTLSMGQHTELPEDKVRELPKPVARLSTSPTKANEASLEEMNRRGVWSCRSCHHLNLERSEMCRCGDSRSGAGLCYGSLGRRGNGSSFGFPDVRPGDWYCIAGKCGAHNFASRSSCFKCGAVKDDSAGGDSDCDLPQNTWESRRPLTLFPSLLDGSDVEPIEDEVLKVLDPLNTFEQAYSMVMVGSDAAEAEDILSVPSPYKVHRAMCTELMRLVNRAMSLLPEIEAARPQCSSGMQALCSFNQAIEKARQVLQHCSEASKLYLVYTADAILSRCERSRKLLEQSLLQIQNNVPVLLAIKISQFIDDIRSATFTLDLSEEEAVKVIHQLVHHGAPESGSVEDLELIKTFQSVVSRLHITSPKAILIERRSIRKLLNKVGDDNTKKKKILTYFSYLFKKYGNQIVAEQAETIEVESDKLFLNDDTKCDPEPRRSARVENQTSPGDILSDPVILEEFKCPLSSRLMYDPVVIASGQTFERVWIQKWFDEGNNTCPKTKVQLNNLSVTPNGTMKDMISKWCAKHGVSMHDPSVELKIEATPSLDHSFMSIASIGDSVNDLHIHMDLSNVSFGSLDTSFNSDSSLPKITRTNENSKKKSLDSIWRLSELPWLSQCELVEDFRRRVEHNGQALYTASPENFLSPISKFVGEAIHHRDIKAQRNAAQLLLAYMKKSRYGAKDLTEESYSVVVSLYSSEEVKEEALAIIETLSSQPHCRPKIAASGALALILDALCSRSRGLQGSALRILHNLSSDSDLRPLILSLDHIIPKLVPFLKDTKVSRHALFILQHLCDIEAARISITETRDCIAPIAELLDTGNSEEQQIALSIFLMLCSQRLEYCQLVLDEGFAVIPALVNISINGSEKLKVSAMELLRLLKDVNVVEDQQDYSSRTDPGQARP